MQGTVELWTQLMDDPASAELVGRAPIEPTPADIGRLRKKWSAEMVSLAIEVARARAKAAVKFGDEVAGRLAGDVEGVEVASSARTASHKARRFVEALGADASVVDLCCGIGGDAMAFAAAGLDVTGVDRDPVRAWMCARNAGCATQAVDVLDPSLPDGVFHLDPARRDGGSRTRRYEDFEPGPEVIQAIIAARTTGAIKLNPGIDAGVLPEGELEIISEGGRLTQAVLWTGAFVHTARSATLLARDGSTHTIGGEPGTPRVAPLGDAAFIHTIDPSVERAGLLGVLAAMNGLTMPNANAGLMPADHAIDSPWLTPFAMLDRMPWQEDRVRRRVAELGGGLVEVKTRGKVVDPDVVQMSLRGSGDRPLVVFVQRIGGDVEAIIAERVGLERIGGGQMTTSRCCSGGVEAPHTDAGRQHARG